MLDGRIYRWATITFPYTGVKNWGPVTEWGSVNMAGTGGFASTGSDEWLPAGFYEPRVLRWGSVTFGGWDRSCSLRFPQLTMTIDDTDMMFSKIVASGENIMGSPVSVNMTYVNNGSISNSWNFTGVLSSWQQDTSADKMRWNLIIRADDTPYNKTIIYPITQDTFPNAPNQTLQLKIHNVKKVHRQTATTTTQAPFGVAAPIIYGLHDSAGITNTGACPAIHVDTTNFYALVSWGWTTILRVYKNNVRQTFPSAAVAQLNTVVGGQMYTLLAFNSDQSANTWTVDVQGYESVGDGTGTSINDPGSQMLHFIRNVACLGTTPPVRGIWNTSGGNVVASDFTLSTMALRAAGKGYKGSRHISQSTTALQEINSWAETWQLYPYINQSGNIGVMYDDPQESAVNWNNGTNWFRYTTNRDFETLTQEFDQDGLIGEAIISPNSLASGGDPRTPLHVVNPLSNSSAIENMNMPWGPAFQ